MTTYFIRIMKKNIFAIVLGLLLTAPLVSLAADNEFFEFAPDVGAPIAVTTGSVAVQEFKIYNDHLNSIDIWFDNAGSSGSATVTLLNSANVALASVSASIAHSDPFYSGQRLHIPFSRTVSTVSGSWYKLKIASNTAQLRLYAVPRVQFVEHNAPYPIDTAVGASFLDSDSLFYAFKFALYENTDATAPVITNTTVTPWGGYMTKISFNASELADRSLTYAPLGSQNIATVGYTGSYSICFEGVFSCSVTIDTQPGTLYTYQLSVRDSWGNTSHVDGMFTTLGYPPPPAITSDAPPASQPPAPQPSVQQPVTQPLAISDARIVSVTGRSATASWNTDRAANGMLVISTDPTGLHAVDSVTDTPYELVHTISTDKDLVAHTKYYATIISHDVANVMAAQTISFTTTDQPVMQNQPAATTTSLQVSISFDQQSALFSWSAPAGGEPANGYRIDIIDEKGMLFRTIRVSAGVHSASVPGLVAGDYHAIAYADRNGVIERIVSPAVVSVRKPSGSSGISALIRKPAVYVSIILLGMIIGGAYWYRTRKSGGKI